MRHAAGLAHTLAWYVAPHDLAATLADMASVLGSDRLCVVARELTKVMPYRHGNTKQEPNFPRAWHSTLFCFMRHYALRAQLQTTQLALGTHLWQHGLLRTL